MIVVTVAFVQVSFTWKACVRAIVRRQCMFGVCVCVHFEHNVSPHCFVRNTDLNVLLKHSPG